jgi:hypothetical protein
MDRHGKPDRSQIASMVGAAATPSRAPRGPLAALVRARRPDRLLPGATEWLRRWGPHRVTADAPDCTCAAGRCAWCN